MNETETRSEHRGCERGDAFCPLCALRGALGRVQFGQSEFFTHLRNARIEALRAVRSVVDNRISALEKDREAHKKKPIKIEVE